MEEDKQEQIPLFSIAFFPLTSYRLWVTKYMNQEEEGRGVREGGEIAQWVTLSTIWLKIYMLPS